MKPNILHFTKKSPSKKINEGVLARKLQSTNEKRNRERYSFDSTLLYFEPTHKYRFQIESI